LDLRGRQQTKWVVFGLTIAIVGFVLTVVLEHAFLPPALQQSSVLQTFVVGTFIYGFLLLIPISIAIAILRSRLYDIDIVINRALVYGLLTGILGLLYAGLIIGLESLAGAITGQASGQPVRKSIRASTYLLLCRRRCSPPMSRSGCGSRDSALRIRCKPSLERTEHRFGLKKKTGIMVDAPCVSSAKHRKQVKEWPLPLLYTTFAMASRDRLEKYTSVV
jgi:hypothetical protein